MTPFLRTGQKFKEATKYLYHTLTILALEFQAFKRTYSVFV